jgi:mRNA interferase RelE/StbE
MGSAAWQVEVSPDAFRQLERLDEAIADRVTAKLRWLREHADEVDHLPLRGSLAGLYKLRVGDWRAIYQIDSERRLVIVLAVEHRREAYRR